MTAIEFAFLFSTSLYLLYAYLCSLELAARATYYSLHFIAVPPSSIPPLLLGIFSPLLSFVVAHLVPICILNTVRVFTISFVILNNPTLASINGTL